MENHKTVFKNGRSPCLSFLTAASVWKSLRKQRAVCLILLLGSVFILNTTFVFADGNTGAPPSVEGGLPGSAFEQMLARGEPMAGKHDSGRSLETPRGRITRRILSLPFRGDVVYEVLLGYGTTVELELPEEVRDIVIGDDRLVATDYLKDKVYLKGVAYSVGESTSIHINTVPDKTLHLWVRIVEPETSDYAFKFTVASKTVFTKSHIRRELEKEKEKLEKEMAKRETNLEAVTEQLAEEKLKVKILKEEKAQKKVKIRKNDLEVKDLQVSRVGARVYVKFTLQNRSKTDFSVSSILLARGVPDPKDSGEVLGFETIETDPPTIEADVIPGGETVKVLLALDRSSVRQTGKVVIKVIEAGGAGRVAEFKDIRLLTR